MTSLQRILTISTLLTSSICHAFVNPINHPSSRLIQSPISSSLQAETLQDTAGNLHGESACFLPILQNDDEYIAPRIVQVCFNFSIWYYIIYACFSLWVFGLRLSVLLPRHGYVFKS